MRSTSRRVALGLLLAVVPGSAAAATDSTALITPAVTPAVTPAALPKRMRAHVAAGLDPTLWTRAVRAYEMARERGLVKRPRLVLIDYTKPSREERLWVVDMERGRVLFRELVAHGKGSGAGRATRFSNVPGSLATSVGVFLTADVYRGEHGKSLRLDGLEPGFNDKARERAIVIHAAGYVDARLAKRQGRIGRSWGCPALPTATASAIIDEIAGGALVFAWGEDTEWQRRSAFLRGQAPR